MYSALLLFYFQLIIIYFSTIECRISSVYSNQIAVEIPGGEEHAKHVVKKHGLTYLGSIGTLENMYLVEHPRISKRSTKAALQDDNLLLDPEVLWVAQQKVHRRVKRSSRTRSLLPKEAWTEQMMGIFNDPEWPQCGI